MTKRSTNFEDTSNKKPKFDDVNDFWGDDFDSDEIEECFNRATQENQTQAQNTTILPSYNSFKKPQAIFSSTQAELSQLAITTSGIQIQQLKQKYEEKEGEVSILRANLRDLRSSFQTEQEKKENEWKEKYDNIVKESKAIKSELQFKNLEVTNLKEKIRDLSKFVRADQSQVEKYDIQEYQSKIPSPCKLPETKPRDFHKVFINSEKYYPFKNVKFPFIYNNNGNQDYSSLHFQVSSRSIISKKDEQDLEAIYPKIFYLINVSLHDIDSNNFVATLTEVLYIFCHLVANFSNFIKETEANLHLQEVQKIDALYLKNNSVKLTDSNNFNHSNSKSISYVCGKLLQFLAEISSLSTFLSNHLLKEKPQNLVCNSNNGMKLEHDFQNRTYLEIFSELVSGIGRTRRGEFCSEFLSGLLNLISKPSYEDKCEPNLIKQVSELTKEILFARPDRKTIIKATYFFKIVTKFPAFVDSLCSNSNSNIKNKDVPVGVLYVDTDSCTFYLFEILFENIMQNPEFNTLPLNISSNILSIVYNVLKCYPSWLCQQENNKCDCLSKLYKLAIEITYKVLERYKETRHEKINEFSNFFKSCIKILSLLTFNSFDLTQKYVMDFAQFREICYSLLYLSSELNLNEDDVSDLQRLSLNEEVPQISSNNFIGLDL